MPSTEARMAGRLPQPVATKRTANNNARATVVALICWPAIGARTAVTAAMLPTATRYPTHLVYSVLTTDLPLSNTSALLLQRARAAVIVLWSTTTVTLDSAATHAGDCSTFPVPPIPGHPDSPDARTRYV